MIPPNKLSTLVFRSIAVCSTLLSMVTLGQPVRAATVTGLYNTGFSNTGANLPVGAADVDYNIITAVGPFTTGPALVVDPATVVPQGWLPDTLVSHWIGPKVDQTFGQMNGTAGLYIYRTDPFTVSGGGTATIAGRWAMDNEATMFLIDNAIGVRNQVTLLTSGFSAWSGFTLPPLAQGSYHLECDVNNFSNATGLRVEDVIPSIPEPSTIALLLCSVAVLLGKQRRR